MSQQKENTGYTDKQGRPLYVGSLVKYPWYGRGSKLREFTIQKNGEKLMAVPVEDTEELWPFNIAGETEKMSVERS